MKRYVPMRNVDNPHHVELMPVSEDVYAEITRETSRIRNKKQYHGQCACPRKYLWKCDGDCSLCEYCAAGDNLSLDYENELHGEHFSDGSDIEEMVTDQLMVRLILERLAELERGSLQYALLRYRRRIISCFDCGQSRGITDDVFCNGKRRDSHKSILQK